MRFAQVILDIPTQALDTAYTYGVPDEGFAELEVGCAVLVPLGGRRAIGFVISLEDEAPASLNAKKIRAIERVVSAPYFSKQGAAVALHLAHEYLAPLSSCIRLFTPPGGVPKAVRTAKGWQVQPPAVGEIDDRWVTRGEAFGDFVPRKNAIKQIQVLAAVAQGDVRVAELAAEYGAVGSTLKALEAKDAVRLEHRRRLRGIVLPADEAGFAPTQKPALTPGQSQALQAIVDAYAKGDGQVVLVDGVTGSGKTEVYLQAIEHVLACGQTACVLVPEISLTPQTVGRFRGRFGNVVAVMHSRMSQGERYDQWDFIRSGQAKVVVGARSALFTPLDNLGLIVIDEEHEGSYKQDSAPRYVTRDVAAWIAQDRGAALVLGSATPSMESLAACQRNPRWRRVELPCRANGRPMPRVQVVDMAKEFSQGHRKMFSRQLAAALESELALGHKAILLLNQRGFANFVLCRDCGFVPECSQCATSLTYHERGNVLICHHCGHQRPTPATCPECGSPYLRRFGAGTQRVESELQALLSEFSSPARDAVIIRMDADTTTKKGAHQRLLDEFAAAPRAVLLGTQMIAKGLDFDDVTVVGVINADTTLKLPDYRAEERTYDLISQVAGRAGRAALDGVVYVQTYNAQAVSIRAAATYNRPLLLDSELPKREILGYPPFVRLVNVLVWGKEEGAVRDEACHLEALIRDSAQEAGMSLDIFAASPCLLAKLRGDFRWHVLIKVDPSIDVHGVVEPVFRKRKAVPGISVAVDVDPDSLF